MRTRRLASARTTAPAVSPAPSARPGLPEHDHRDRILVPLSTLRPTQATVGMRAVAVKRRKIEKRLETPSRIATFLAGKPIPSVRGPGGHLFMIDHHHLGLALWQAEVETAYVYVIEDLSVMPVAAFWSRMEADGRVYPFDAEGRRIKPTRLPSRLNALREDSFRDLAWSVREAGGFAKSRLPFAEFQWADYFRVHVSERLVKRDYDAAVARALKLARAKAACELPGYLPR
jgi:hypothetical protein